jgi:hypothetical protein
MMKWCPPYGDRHWRSSHWSPAWARNPLTLLRLECGRRSGAPVRQFYPAAGSLRLSETSMSRAQVYSEWPSVPRDAKS